MQQTSSDGDTANFLSSMNDPTVIERVRCMIKHAHVFKLPPRQAASIGWRGADWKDKVWQGNVKVVDRNDLTAVLLVEKNNNRVEHGGGSGGDNIFAVCPIKEGAVERCVDSSRYFVLRIENQNGRHMFIGVAFNERNDAFDFNTALEDAKREHEFDMKIQQQNGEGDGGGDVFSTLESSRDYSLKEGEKIHVAIPNKKKNRSINIPEDGGTAAFANFKLDSPDAESVASSQKPSKPRVRAKPKPKPATSSFFGNLGKGSGTTGGFVLKPSTKDTPTRTQNK
eukprot:CAMPEP_0203673756 /NCGR_PEP_ID=MMETSP0090-20130426/13672_1 /ASSEMBLY_ACC=CAM_ASM_001088 /TAXON_ID=426623 /ORGANISM="Chaetoceros affinis, Strain CCMP159" /LENGTH=281 /DNA_ID=CAMNT_0050539473 /DNA_START=254 /DNA_END=1099 /DNA_ORIENTATION=+